MSGIAAKRVRGKGLLLGRFLEVVSRGTDIRGDPPKTHPTHTLGCFFLTLPITQLAPHNSWKALAGPVQSSSSSWFPLTLAHPTERAAPVRWSVLRRARSSNREQYRSEAEVSMATVKCGSRSTQFSQPTSTSGGSEPERTRLS